jgi:DNA-directed RNA polymerase subunit omega
MLEPAVSVLREKADSRYSLVIMAAKRARDLVDGKPSLLLEEEEGPGITKPVSIAVHEIAKELISYRRGEGAETEDEYEPDTSRSYTQSYTEE